MNYSVDLVAAFLGLTFLPHPLVIGTNNLNPELVLQDDGITYRSSFTKGYISYAQIKSIGFFKAWATKNVIVTTKGSVFTHCFNIRSEKQVIETLKIFKEKGCDLSTKASTYLAEHDR